ncbi:MAG TPA: polysaccharide biosynthesis tyrosine autokinase [Longimicrobiaceae bacterium]|nr:polysaccharide biosynthesis tyrosine autokinase [Longimicrobiaceae bacterium]
MRSLPTPHDTATSLPQLWDAVARNRWLIVKVTLGVMLVVGAITIFAPRIYESEAVLRIESEKGAGGLLENMGPLAALGGLSGLGGGEIDTEIGVLRSRYIAAAVTDSLALNLELDEPDRPRHRVLEILEVDANAVEGEYKLTRRPDGLYDVSASDLERPVDLPTSVAAGEPFAIGNMKLAISDQGQSAPPAEIRFEVLPFQETVHDLREQIEIEAQKGGSNLVEIQYRHNDPYIAAAVVNSVANIFMDYKLRTSKFESRSKAEELREQVAEYEVRLREAEIRLREFQEQEQVIAPEEAATQQVKRLAEMQVARDALQIERAALVQLLKEVEAAPTGGDGPSPYRQLATFPSFITNSAVQNLLATLNALENRRAELLIQRTEESLDVIGLDQRIDELELQLYRMATDYVGSLGKQIASTDRALDAFGLELATIPADAIQFARLTRDIELLTEVYLLLQTQLKEAEIQEAIERDAVRVIDTGIVAEEPYFPKPVVMTILSGVLGLMLGMMAVIGREAMDTKVRSRGEAEWAAGLPVLATIPKINYLQPSTNGSARGKKWLGKISPQSPGGLIAAPSTAAGVRKGSVADAFRTLRTNIAFSAADAAPQMIIVTSAQPGEGKSTTAANLAMALAQQDHRTLLVDADFGDGTLSSFFAAHDRPGLAEALRGEIPLSEAIYEVELDSADRRLHVLATGAEVGGSADLLASPAMASLLREMRSSYTSIIFDLPALGETPDAALLGRSADGTILVAREGITEQENLNAAVVQLERLSASILGVVLNKA